MSVSLCHHSAMGTFNAGATQLCNTANHRLTCWDVNPTNSMAPNGWTIPGTASYWGGGGSGWTNNASAWALMASSGFVTYGWPTPLQQPDSNDLSAFYSANLMGVVP